MTREEAIKALEHADSYVGIHYINGVEEAYINPHLREAVKVALTALRLVSREQVERMRGEWISTGAISCKCSKCNKLELKSRADEYNFCPHCMAPMTDEVVEMVMERWEALKDGKAD